VKNSEDNAIKEAEKAMARIDDQGVARLFTDDEIPQLLEETESVFERAE
jgi:hypothetical protein